MKIGRRLQAERLEAEPLPSESSGGNPTGAARHHPTATPTSPQRRGATPGCSPSRCESLFPSLFPSFFPTKGHSPSRFSSDSKRSFGESRKTARESVLYPVPAKPPAADVSLGTGGKQLTT